MITKKTNLEELIKSKNNTLINEMILAKKAALEEAINNVEFFKEKAMYNHAENESARVQLLQRDLNKLYNKLN